MQENQAAAKQSARKVGGSRKGIPNKASATVKENILAVFNRLDGTAGMAKWAKANPSEFYRLYARLLPIEVDAAVSGTIIVEERDPTQRPSDYHRKGKAST